MLSTGDKLNACLVIGGAGCEAVKGSFTLWVLDACPDLLATLGAHLPYS